MLRERLSAQLLAGPPAKDPETVVERLLAVQGQDPRGARLAIRARSEGLAAADVDRALNERLLLITWLNRGTLHLVRSEDYPWLQALTAPRLMASSARRLVQEGLTPGVAERGMKTIECALAEEGPLTRIELRERLVAAGVRTEGQALLHLLFAVSLRGVAVRGPMIGREHAYVLVRDWLPTHKPIERGRALKELARRFLAGHGPADDRDLAKWAGLPLRDARDGLGAIASELTERADGLLDLARREAAAELPPPRLLGSFDPVLHGWVSRAPMLAEKEPIITLNGVFRPFALVRGRAVAVWSMRAGKIALRPFGRLTRADTAALRADALAVAAYLDGEPVSA
ncbi:MAG: winged helix DNA-binding domain-containing protein [Solirubrobacteraceae bacterium]